ncbi:(d)CMP kinase [Aquimarina agarivorans]|uniref:(d)CMP kinase n=1 Tax=Aquimarina agarivorans TaxID=980584 RepID=UPI000248EA95|nr:(d)CMP kinase [Aquimarina agarivorans]
MSTKIIIAIDGHSSTGKSTVAKQLAKHLGYTYVDTGAMYRSVTWYAIQHEIISANELDVELLIKSLPKITLRFKLNTETGYADAHINGENVEKEIRSLKVSGWVSKVAAISEVRKKLVEQQQQMGKEKALVMDGRDIGTVVFPDAELKIFMTASPEERANRRFLEMIANGEQVSYDEVLQNVKERDYIDTTRQDSPLIKAEDAIVIDNSTMSKETQFKKLVALAENLIN